MAELQELYLRFSIKWGGYPNSWMVFLMEHPIKMDDLPQTILNGFVKSRNEGNHRNHSNYWAEIEPTHYAGWWFGTFFIFPYIGNNHPN